MQTLLAPASRALAGQTALTLGWCYELSLRCLSQKAQASTSSAAAAAPPVKQRQVTAINCYIKEAFAGVRKQNPSLNVSETLSTVAKQFKELSEADKLKFKGQAQALNEARAKALEQALAEVKQAKEAKTQLNKAKYANKYNIFLKASIPKLREAHPSASMPEIFAMIGQQWKKMPSAEQDKFKPSA